MLEISYGGIAKLMQANTVQYVMMAMYFVNRFQKSQMDSYLYTITIKHFLQCKLHMKSSNECYKN